MSILLLHRANASRRGHLARAAEYARSHDERLLIAMDGPTWESEFADVVVSVDTSDIHATVEVARDLAATEDQPIRAVAAFVGHSVPAAAAVAADLACTFISEKAAHTVRDKYAMRQAFSARHLPQPRHGLARTVQEAREQAARIGFPLVVKPIVDNDTGYLRRVDDLAELAEHFPALQQGAWAGVVGNQLLQWAVDTYDGAVLMEEYLPGPEVSVESVVIHAHTHVIAVHDKPHSGDGPFFTDLLYLTPTGFPAAMTQTVCALAAAANQAVGIDVGAAHTECRIAQDGTLRVLETAARIGGGPVYQSVLLSTGIDMVAAALDLACGRRPDISSASEATPAGFFLVYAPRAGMIRAIAGVDEARRNPEVSEVSLYKEVGDEVDVPPSTWQSHGHVVLTASDRARLLDLFREMSSSITIDVEGHL